MNSTEQLLSQSETSKRVSLGRTTIWKRVKSGDFPAPVQIGERKIAFVRSEIEAWISARIAERDEAAA